MKKMTVLLVLVAVITSGCGYMMCRAFLNPAEVCRRQPWQDKLLFYDPWTAGSGERNDD